MIVCYNEGETMFDDGERRCKMERDRVLKQLADKELLEAVQAEAETNSELLALLVEIVTAESSSIRYAASKVVRKLSETKPEAVYPHFEAIAAWLQAENSFIKWDGILTLANLASVDDEQKMVAIYDDYFALLGDAQMITAGNVAGNAWKIVLAHPEWEADITRRLLAVPQTVYLHKGAPSPECNRIVCGKVLESFTHYFAQSAHQAEILAFAETQRSSARPAVAKKADEFVKKYGKWA